MVDGVLLLGHLHLLISLISLDLSQHLVQRKDLPLGSGHFDGINVNEVDDFLLSAQSHEVLASLQDLVVVLVQLVVLLLHRLDL